MSILQQFVKDPHYRVVALTNWSAETFPIALDRFEFLQWFEGIVVSGAENTRKPFSEIYQLTLDRFKMQAQECLFIDDNLRNVEGAKALGIQGYHFTTPQQLKEDLLKEAILK